jgi:hypothetical protein
VPEPLVEQPQPNSVATPVERGDRGLGKRGCAVRPAGGKGRLGRLLLELGRVAVRCGQRERALDRRQGVGRCVAGGGVGCRRHVGVARRPVVVRPLRVMGRHHRTVRQGRREGRVIADPRERQEILLDRLGNQLVPEVQPFAGLDEEAVFDRLLETRGEVRVEDRPRAAGCARRSGRSPGRRSLEGRRRLGQLGRPKWHARWRQQAEHPPTFR